MYAKNWWKPYTCLFTIKIYNELNSVKHILHLVYAIPIRFSFPYYSTALSASACWCLTVFQLFHSRLICIKPAQAVCRTIWILNDVWQWTRTPSILLRTQNMWHVSWVWAAGLLVVTSKCIKVCVMIHNLYFVLWNSNTNTCNHELQSSKKVKAC